MPIENRNLEIGTRLVANYKKQAYVCTVEAGEGDEGVAFVLENGKRFKSPSAAGSSVMGGKAVNGWRFWAVEGATTPVATEAAPTAPRTRTKANSAGTETKPVRRAKKLIFRGPNQQGVPEGKVRWFCAACMKSFIGEPEQPEACPEGHRIDDPELGAPFAEPLQKESEDGQSGN